MATLQLEIVTPQARTYSDTVDFVTLPTESGEIRILPGHDHLLTTLRPGELIAKKGDQLLPLATGQGFAQVTPTHVRVLTDMAMKAEEINEEQVEEALRRAQAALADKSLPVHQTEAMALMIDKSIAQLRLKRRRQS